jgi:hypothetical protein
MSKWWRQLVNTVNETDGVKQVKSFIFAGKNRSNLGGRELGGAARRFDRGGNRVSIDLEIRARSFAA